MLWNCDSIETRMYVLHNGGMFLSNKCLLKIHCIWCMFIYNFTLQCIIKDSERVWRLENARECLYIYFELYLDNFSMNSVRVLNCLLAKIICEQKFVVIRIETFTLENWKFCKMQLSKAQSNCPKLTIESMLKYRETLSLVWISFSIFKWKNLAIWFCNWWLLSNFLFQFPPTHNYHMPLD